MLVSHVDFKDTVSNKEKIKFNDCEIRVNKRLLKPKLLNLKGSITTFLPLSVNVSILLTSFTL